MKIEINIDNIPEDIQDFANIFCKSFEKELDKQKKEIPSGIKLVHKDNIISNPGYGYYFLKTGDKIENNDSFYFHKNWEPCSNSNITKIYHPDIYLLHRRAIPIPTDYILVPEGDEIHSDYMCINPTIDNIWTKLDKDCCRRMLSGYTYCKPIKKIFDRTWFLNGCRKTNILINTDTPEEANKFNKWFYKNEGKLRALQILEDKIAEKNGHWKPIFDRNNMPAKYLFSYEYLNSESTYATIKINLVNYLHDCSNSLYFKSKEVGLELIEELGEEFIRQALGFE